MNIPSRIALALVLASCGGSSGTQHVAFAKLVFDMPSDWSSHDSIWRGTSTAVWTPDENADAKESVTVIRSEKAAPVAQAGSPTLDSLVASADAGLPGAKTSSVIPILTQSGLAGVRVEVEFTPPGMRERYHRVHIVLVDHAHVSLIHVMYTARNPDEKRSALNLVLSTIRESEG